MSEKMRSENRKIAAETLVKRLENRLEQPENPLEEEKDRLFFWILERLHWSVEGCFPA